MPASMPVLQTTLHLCCVGTFHSKLAVFVSPGSPLPALIAFGVLLQTDPKAGYELEQHMLQRAKLTWMKGGDQCSRIFFRKVAKRRASKRIFQITNTAGQILTDQQDVIMSSLPSTRRYWEVNDGTGPDGYPSGFFKAARPVIGKEVTQAILDFFTTGRLLKQVNATLLSLIPKVLNPTLVSEFRSISCYNVLYKVITKIIVQRLSGVLDDLISPPQNALVPGRSIGDNILLAQELFHGYNQQHLPPRCALKVDIRKAYDTGARGLRQGDPISPYLFVLVMEVLNLILQQIIEQDGLHVNPHKSHLILSRSASGVGDTLLTLLDFRERFLPLRSSNQCLLHSQVYWAMAFILPKTIIREIEKRLRSFLWKDPYGGGLQKSHGNRLRTHSVWTVSDHTGSWGWRKLIRLRGILQQFVEYKIGSGASFSLWHDLWHELGPLILQFPMGPCHTDILPTAFLNTVIMEGAWCWPSITNMESVEITHSLPIIYGGEVRIGLYGLPQGGFVGGSCLPSMQERNYRIFRAATRSPWDIATIIVSEVRELIISKELPQTVSTRGLYRLCRIPWPVEGDATL
ncbi:UNVERIFIED_CONTAM: LINE-1 retrotransposable element O protein [Sesamum latifolium]|uniref:LINE-1 retrotransposable element O protein n=1 Tax=Sesamum latifolium TaxID=2727402 RepID=A0AAW2XN06_9LAMI